MEGIVDFFQALFEMIVGILVGNGKFEEVGYVGIVYKFLNDGLFSQLFKKA